MGVRSAPEPDLRKTGGILHRVKRLKSAGGRGQHLVTESNVMRPRALMPTKAKWYATRRRGGALSRQVGLAFQKNRN